jgi:hypothetical protein
MAKVHALKFSVQSILKEKFMGFNTLVVIHNDRLHTIAHDKDFGEKIFNASVKCYADGTPIHITGGVVIDSYHADSLQLVIAGWNSAAIVGEGAGNPGHVETQIKMLKSWAESLGFNVSKKRPARKSALKPADTIPMPDGYSEGIMAKIVTSGETK